MVFAYLRVRERRITSAGRQRISSASVYPFRTSLKNPGFGGISRDGKGSVLVGDEVSADRRALEPELGALDLLTC